MVRMRAGLAVVAIAGAVVAGAGSALADTPSSGDTVVLVPGGQEVRPDSVELTPADAGDLVTGITWVYWGHGNAFGVGTETVKTCRPSCVDGGSTRAPVVIRLSDAKPLADQGNKYFARATVYGVFDSHSVALW